MKANLTSPWLDRATLAALLLYLVAIPVTPSPLDSAHNWARLAQMPVLALAAASLLPALMSRRAVTWGAGLLGGAILVLAMASSLRADIPWVALREVALMAGLAGLVHFVARTCASSGSQVLVRATVTAWALYGAVSLVVLSTVFFSAGLLNSWKLVIGFDNPRFLNHAQTVAIPLLLGIAGHAQTTRPWRRLAWFALVLSVVWLILTMGRATLVGLGLTALMAPLVFPGSGLRYTKRLCLAFLLGTMCYGLLFRGAPDLLGISDLGRVAGGPELSSDHSRFYLWRIAGDFIAESPWLGIGPMHFSHHPNLKGAHPHNVYLQVAAEYGLPLLLLLAVVAFGGLARIARRLRQEPARQDASLAVGAWLACVAAASDGMFSGNFVMPVSQLWIAVAIGWAIGCTPAAADRAPASGPATWRAWPWALMLLGSQLWLGSLTFQEAQKKEPVVGQITRAIDPSMPLRPRYWVQGWF